MDSIFTVSPKNLIWDHFGDFLGRPTLWGRICKKLGLSLYNSKPIQKISKATGTKAVMNKQTNS